MRIITQPDGFIEVFDGAHKIAYVENDRLYLIGQGAPLGEVKDRSDIVRLINQHRAGSR